MELLPIAFLIIVVLLCFGSLYFMYGQSMWDKTYCMDCHIKMKETGYIAHGFKRAYNCPLCNALVYVDDPVLREQRIREIEKENA